MPFAAARVLDPTTHVGMVSGPGVPNVLIGGLPAAVAGDAHTCGLPPIPHPPSPFPMGSPTVFIGGRPALRASPTDMCGCGAQVGIGFPTVLIGP